MYFDTIAAVATAPGEAGIGIVRISGEKALEIVDKIFRTKKERKLSDFQERRLTYGYIVEPDTGKKIDEVLAVYMKAPYTYTKEDIVEINCHGGMIPVRRILEIVLENGARLAEPGEFTKRAFLNGRIDLSQAEAVIDLIRAKTDSSFDVSFNQLEGGLSKEINEIREILLRMLANIEASIDFPEEDIETMTYKELVDEGNNVLKRIEKLLDTVYTGKILREGLKTVILGKPNVGKSSLMNAILRENRAIVTDIPGTTRDIIEEYVNIKGIPLKIIDTAGIRETEDVVERIGVERAKSLLEEADLVIVLFDVSKELTEEDMEIARLVKNKKVIVLTNKIDLPPVVSREEIEKILPGKKIIETSIIKGEGLEVLEDSLKEMFFAGEIKIKDNTIVTNARHKSLLLKAKKNIEEAIESIEMGMPIDCIEVDVKDCWENLGQITGDTVTEDIIDKIFEEFCIGK
ncbi:tRNA uridine-5-carboxymethylaminomethyl(34) synthesis GTPase MnmE [Caloranaerobacter azorensis]|uniref:tRNA modification GTPase MnmE n=1 Tax=Caloranaerobacter azorensis TaxID=116090 RepID=A0A6P1YI17_9FIRM|nr:tRNA uridine-5-carboxymethylaminomethyl(34) synthesis GTPase MnmE [Caloranaerobacter azorensis]QIB27865.1 tRNA uridine-5-carboxymethylaminomethyl(34) synthesis GTPase MnmE [Caloranaerobacter azorensis]